ncbi:MAG: flagellar hook assembly protein FlgD [Bdellovibrio sp.]|jgi:flagellar basal-body rod modification protein FlgD
MAMMGIKRDTKAFSTNAASENRKSEGVNNLSAQDMQKLGGEDVGALLNRVADPNWIDPSKKIRAVGSDKMDKDAFMKLMLAQMKNQDPTNPLKSHEMAAQLAQFSQLEQLQNVNTTLESMQAAQKPSETYQSLNFIGKTVAGDAARVHRSKGDRDHEFNFTLPDSAKEAVIKVRNSAGDYIREVKLANLKAGDNRWVWNGKNDSDSSAPVGDYQILIEAKNASDQKLNVKTDFNGVITGVNYTPEGPVLLVGSQSVKLKDVRKIVGSPTGSAPEAARAPLAADSGLNHKVQKSGDTLKPDLKKAGAASQTEQELVAEEGAKEEAIGAQPNLLDQVGLSREMMSRLEKETKPDSKAGLAQPASQSE